MNSITPDKVLATLGTVSEDFRRCNPQLFAKTALETLGVPDRPKDTPQPEIATPAQSLYHSEASESQSQQALIRWWSVACHQFNLPEIVLMAFPLQGLRTKANGARLKAEGMRAGTADLFLMVPRACYHGLWIEMKARKGRLTDTQIHFKECAERHGYCHKLCRGSEQARQAVETYLRLPNYNPGVIFQPEK